MQEERMFSHGSRTEDLLHPRQSRGGLLVIEKIGLDGQDDIGLFDDFFDSFRPGITLQVNQQSVLGSFFDPGKAMVRKHGGDVRVCRRRLDGDEIFPRDPLPLRSGYGFKSPSIFFI